MRMTILTILLTMAISSMAFGSQTVDSAKIIDLTHTFDKQTIYWPTEGSFHHEWEHFGTSPEGFFYSSAKYAAAEHGGTHMDAPLHFNRKGDSADKVALANCIGPAVVIDFSARAAKDPNAMLMVADIEQYEKAYGAIPDGAIVVARSGCGKFWPNKKRYLGTSKPGDVAGLRFPGFSSEALKYLLAHRKVAAIAIDTASIDPGISKDFIAHQVWLGANKPAFENVANVEKLPARGATIFCIPAKIGEGTGAPTRIFAILP
jgi:kynurenine formamidase